MGRKKINFNFKKAGITFSAFLAVAIIVVSAKTFILTKANHYVEVFSSQVYEGEDEIASWVDLGYEALKEISEQASSNDYSNVVPEMDKVHGEVITAINEGNYDRAREMILAFNNMYLEYWRTVDDEVHGAAGCSDEYLPVCGTDEVTYENECMADQAGVYVEYQGACETYSSDGNDYNNETQSEQIDTSGEYYYEENECPDYYAPVCGIDGVTYENECMANQVNVYVEYEGVCGDYPGSDYCPENSPIQCSDGSCATAAAECPGFDGVEECSDEYLPVCGIDGETYQNECIASELDVYVEYQGACKYEDYDNGDDYYNEEQPDYTYAGCPDEYEPVCSDGETWYNACEAEEAGVSFEYGSCEELYGSDDDYNEEDHGYYDEYDQEKDLYEWLNNHEDIVYHMHYECSNYSCNETEKDQAGDAEALLDLIVEAIINGNYDRAWELIEQFHENSDDFWNSRSSRYEDGDYDEEDLIGEIKKWLDYNRETLEPLERACKNGCPAEAKSHYETADKLFNEIASAASSGDVERAHESIDDFYGAIEAFWDLMDNYQVNKPFNVKEAIANFIEHRSKDLEGQKREIERQKKAGVKTDNIEALHKQAIACLDTIKDEFNKGGRENLKNTIEKCDDKFNDFWEKTSNFYNSKNKRSVSRKDYAAKNEAMRKSKPKAGYEDEVITVTPNSKTNFNDVGTSTETGIAANALYEAGVLGGYPDGEFKSSRAVNRAEAAKFLILARYGEVPNLDRNIKFSDVKAGEWYTKYVLFAAQKGIINGYEDGTFKPGDGVNKAEFMKMLSLTFNIKATGSSNYPDVESGAWFKDYAQIAKTYDLFPGESRFEGSRELTRGEVAIAIYKYMKSVVKNAAGSTTSNNSSSASTAKPAANTKATGEIRVSRPGSTIIPTTPDDLYKFSVTAKGGDIKISRLEFEVTTSQFEGATKDLNEFGMQNNSGKISGYKIAVTSYNGKSASANLTNEGLSKATTKDGVADGTYKVVVTFSTPQEIKDGKTETYRFVGRAIGAQEGAALGIKLNPVAGLTGSTPLFTLTK